MPTAIQVPFRVASIEDVTRVFDETWARLCGTSPGIVLSGQTRADVKSAFVEAVANAARHAFELDRREGIRGRILLNHRSVVFEVEDHGPGFDPDAVPVPDWTDLKGGGRGVFIMRQVGDALSYARGKRGNVLRFRRHLVGAGASAGDMDLLYGLSEAVIRGATPEEVWEIILDQALGLFGVERASILVYDEGLKRLRVAAGRGLSGDVREKTLVRAGEGVSGYVFQHGRALLIEDIDSNRRGLTRKSGYKSGSFISVPMIRSPLKAGERPFGVINLTDRKDGGRFTRRDLKLLSTIANQAMACLSMRDLLSDEQERQRLKGDLDTVRGIQISYLPRSAPVIPGWDMAGACDMAQSVGGDYYDFLPAKNGLYLAVADVSGHDMKSALTMFNFRNRLRTLCELGIPPDEILGRLNAMMFSDLVGSGNFVSAVVMLLDTSSGGYVFASAGHYPPLALKGEGYALAPSGLVLGIEGRETYPLVKGRVAEDDGLVLFTDGLVEAMDAKGDFFGLDRFAVLARDHAGLSCANLVPLLIDAARFFRAPEAILDDITVAAVKRL